MVLTPDRVCDQGGSLNSGEWTLRRLGLGAASLEAGGPVGSCLGPPGENPRWPQEGSCCRGKCLGTWLHLPVPHCSPQWSRECTPHPAALHHLCRRAGDSILIPHSPNSQGLFPPIWGITKPRQPPILEKRLGGGGLGLGCRKVGWGESLTRWDCCSLASSYPSVP